jgi:hypothetical protein
MTHSLAALTLALLFGGMTLYSFGFAAILFTALPAPLAGKTLRQAFPWFYLFVIVTAAIAGLLLISVDNMAAGVMAAVVLSTIAVRQSLMPAINHATDSGNRKRFKWLHSVSVLVTLSHIGASGWLLVRMT